MPNLIKRVQLLVTPALFKQARAEATFQKISVNELFRVALEQHLRSLDKQRIEEAYRENRPIKTRQKV
jgi:hypothetical protein